MALDLLKSGLPILKDNVREARKQVVSVAERTPATPFLPADKFSSADALRMGRTIIQGITRSAARTFMGAEDVLRSVNEDPTRLLKSIVKFARERKIPEVEGREPSELKLDPTATALEKKFFKTVFGTERIAGWAEWAAKKELEAEPIPFLGEKGKKLVVPLFPFIAAMDFTGIGGGRKGLVRLLTELDDPVRISRILEKTGVPADVIKNYAEGFAIAKTKEEVETGLKALERFVETTKAPKVIQPTTKAIPTELEPLAAEARKFRTAEEFVGAVERANLSQREVIEQNIKLTKQEKTLRGMMVGVEPGQVAVRESILKDLRPLKTGESIASKERVLDQLTDFYNQAVKKSVEEAPEALKKAGRAEEALQPQLSPEQQTAEKIAGELPVPGQPPPGTIKEIQSYSKSVIQKVNNVKERGFLTSVRESPQVPDETKRLIEELPTDARYYDIFTDQAAITKATERIGKSHDEALSFVMGADSVDKEVVTTGLELMRRYRIAGNFAMEAEVAANLALKATRTAQGLQAFSILNKLSPEGILITATKRLGHAPSEALSKKLVDQAEKIQNLPFGYEQYRATQDLAEIIARETPLPLGKRVNDFLLELVNIPRSFMASFWDLSGSLRQGIMAFWRHPLLWKDSFKGQFGAFLKEANYEAMMDTVMKNPEFKNAVDAGVGFTDVNAKLTLREERYMSSMAEKIPLIGRQIRATNRAYTIFMNKLRMDTFSEHVKMLDNLGLRDDAHLKRTAMLINDMTGRGDLPKALQSVQGWLNAIFFSPKLNAARLNMLIPARYIASPPAIRREYLKTMMSFAAGTGTTLALAKVAGFDIELDSRNSDFAKIKFNNTRLDVMGGFQQFLRIGSQVISGKYISSTTGKFITLGEGYKPLTRWEVFFRGVESKEAPAFSLFSLWMSGQDMKGEPINWPKEIGDRFTPIIFSDLYELYKEDPRLLPLGFLGALGIGIQSYEQPEAYIKLEEIRSSDDPIGAFDELKENNPKLAEKVERAGIESKFTEFDWSLTYMGVENERRAEFLVQYLKNLPDDQARAEKVQDLKNKKLISKIVLKQMQELWNQ
jgi:hypothetical protein